MPYPYRSRHREGIRAALYQAVKAFARNVFGLEVSRTKYASANALNSGYGYKWISRFMHFERLLQEIVEVDGVIVECGVGPGRSLFDFSVISKAIGRPRRIVAYDTFCGIPDATVFDGEWNADLGGTWNYPQEQVRGNLKATGLDEETIINITLVEGELSTTLASYGEGQIALLHLDVDIYESYKAALECLYDHVMPGGVITFDEYRLEKWPGATKAIDEFFQDKRESIERSTVADRYYVVKCR